MRGFFIYVTALLIAGVAVFLAMFTFGRRPSLEQELARRTAYVRPGERSLSIPSLKPAPPQEPEEPEQAEELTPPEVEHLTEDITLTRYEQEEAGLVLLLDRDILLPEGQRDYFPPAGYRQGLEGFLERLPANYRIGLRSLISGIEGDCGNTVQLKPCGAWSPVELREALRTGPVEGPRSLARGLEDAAADLSGVQGEQAVIIVTSGDEGCGGTPCQVAAALQQAGRPLRIFVVILRPPSGFSPYDMAAPPVWQTRMECLAERGEGMVFQASSAAELRDVLLRIVSSLQPNVTVRSLHATGREVEGRDMERRGSWGAAVSNSASRIGGEMEKHSFPAVFSLPVGEYDLRIWYRGQERSLQRLRVDAAQRVEVQVNFRAGEFYLQSRDADGEELVGDTTDFDCFWGAEVFQGDDLNRDYGASCSFPAHFVLEPGSYTVRAWRGTDDLWMEEIEVKEGETRVETAVFREK